MGNFVEATANLVKSIPTWFASSGVGSSAIAGAHEAAAAGGGLASAAASGSVASGGVLQAAMKAANIGATALQGASALQMLTSKPPKPPAPPAQPNPASILSNKQNGPLSTLGGTYLGIQGAPPTGTKNLLGK